MKYHIKLFVLFVVLLSTVSCDDWLNISPRTEIKTDDNFKTEQGYKDALTGIYLLMTDGSLYGREMTFGMVDVLAQYYTGIYNTTHPYYYAKLYDYKNESNVNRINHIWLNSYNVIANINELIKNIDKADSTMFTGRNYRLIKGEAYGLRAFIHFDLLRLFGPSYTTGPDTKSIPYITNVGVKVTKLSTVKEVLELALKDLNVATAYLKTDPVVANNQTGNFDTNYERDRTFKFNYYAAKMLQARIFLYKKDYEQAKKSAEEVIRQSTFYWTPLEEINSTDSKQRNLIFSEELIFSLYKSDINADYTSYFTGASGLYMLTENYNALYQLYQPGTDHDTRYEYQTVLLDELRFSSKLKQQSSNTAYLFRLPLMRLSEAYYIAAECALNQNDVVGAVKLLNEVRDAREISIPLSESLTASDVSAEIFNEYSKEFFAEGQLFYYFKRLNYQNIPIRSANGASVTTSYVNPVYVFPLPDNETEYGGRTNE